MNVFKRYNTKDEDDLQSLAINQEVQSQDFEAKKSSNVIWMDTAIIPIRYYYS